MLWACYDILPGFQFIGVYAVILEATQIDLLQFFMHHLFGPEIHWGLQRAPRVTQPALHRCRVHES